MLTTNPAEFTPGVFACRRVVLLETKTADRELFNDRPEMKPSKSALIDLPALRFVIPTVPTDVKSAFMGSRFRGNDDEDQPVEMALSALYPNKLG